MRAEHVTTAFVNHHDCSRHDTGWMHPDHQGRLPGLVRSVYRDMLTLHGHLVEVEAHPATDEDLLLVHTPEYVASVREAVERSAHAGRPLPFDGDVMVSAATWDAAVASVGCAVTGTESVLRGEARNAFCSARPPGRGAGAAQAGGHSLFNNVAVAARHLRERRGVGRVLVVDWGALPPLGTGKVLAGVPGVTFLTVHQHPAPTLLHPDPDDPGRGDASSAHSVDVPPGADGAAFAEALERGLDDALREWEPEFILVSLGLDVLEDDPLGGLAVTPRDVYDLTLLLRAVADGVCDGRLVTVLEGGYDAAATGNAVVQHLRAMAGLPPA